MKENKDNRDKEDLRIKDPIDMWDELYNEYVVDDRFSDLIKERKRGKKDGR